MRLHFDNKYLGSAPVAQRTRKRIRGGTVTKEWIRPFSDYLKSISFYWFVHVCMSFNGSPVNHELSRKNVLLPDERKKINRETDWLTVSRSSWPLSVHAIDARTSNLRYSDFALFGQPKVQSFEKHKMSKNPFRGTIEQNERIECDAYGGTKHE